MSDTQPIWSDAIHMAFSLISQLWTVTRHQALWVSTHPVVAPVSCRHQNWWVRASLDTRVLALPEARHLKTGQNSCNCPTLIQSTVNTATVSSDNMNMSGCTRSIRCFYEVNDKFLQPSVIFVRAVILCHILCGCVLIICLMLADKIWKACNYCWGLDWWTINLASISRIHSHISLTITGEPQLLSILVLLIVKAFINV